MTVMTSPRNFFLLIIAVSTALRADAPRVAAVSPDVKARAAANVLRATTAASDSTLEGILKAPVVCGPRLWQRLKRSMPDDNTRVGTAVLIFDTNSGKKSWAIEALDLQKLKPDFRNAIKATLADQPGRIPIEVGVFRGTGVKLLAAALRESFLRRHLSVSQASPADIGYYWLMIPYDIEEPVLRLDTSEASLLLDVDNEGQISWIDLLPEDVAQSDQSPRLSPASHN